MVKQIPNSHVNPRWLSRRRIWAKELGLSYFIPFLLLEHLLYIPGDDQGTRGCDRETVSLIGMSSSVSQLVAVMMDVSLTLPVFKRVGAKANGALVLTKCGLVHIAMRQPRCCLR